MNYPLPLPERASLEWLRKTAKQRLRSMRAAGNAASLAEVQLTLAREYGFTSWRSLKQHVEQATAGAQQTVDSWIASLLRLIASGSINQVRSALAKSPEMVHTKGPHPYWGGQPQPIHIAVESGSVEMVQLVLDSGADPNGDNSSYDHWSPLMLAAAKAEIRELLLARGARVGLVEALMMGDDAMTEKLLSSGELPSVVPNDGSFLAFARTPYAIGRLISLGASPTARDHWGVAPVEALSRLGTRGVPLVRQLEAHGVTAGVADFAALGDTATVEAMVQADPAIAHCDEVLMSAVGGGHFELARSLLKNGANPRARSADQSRHSALHSAAWNGNIEMVRLLMEFGADATERDAQYDATPLGWARTSLDVTRNEGLTEVIAFLSSLESQNDQIQSKKS